MKDKIVRTVRKITFKKLDEFLGLIGYTRYEVNGFGYIKNNYGENTEMITFGNRIEIRDNPFLGKRGKGVVYFDLGSCNMEYRCSEDNWKTLCIYGKENKNLFLQMYDSREKYGNEK